MRIVSKETYIEELNHDVNIEQFDAKLDQAVLEIIQAVREKGDQALFQFTEQFDKVRLDDLIVTKDEFQKAKESVSAEFVEAITTAYENIKQFHELQTEKSWFVNKDDGIMLGQKVTPLNSVGIYVPGGKAAYPSTVLMNVIPAKIAGVEKIAITTPPMEDGTINPHVLVAAEIAGADLIYKVGGAQAVAALAYGTETIQKVVKIVGPGNAFVACAKKWVYGTVDIDMIAGPSEICVVADQRANASFVAADLLSQAEHDERARAICVTTSEIFAQKLQDEVVKQTAEADRKEIIQQSIDNHGRIIVANSTDEAFEVVNLIAPEHLQIMVDNPQEKLAYVKHAGAIFLGDYAPEALGDYLAGPNHTLPTSGTAAFSSPLGVYDFMKKSSIIHYSKKALAQVSNHIVTIAEAEGLSAHANSIKIRQENEP